MAFDFEAFAEVNPQALRMDGYDDCVIGSVARYGMEPVIAYSVEKVIDKLMAQGMTEDEAEEFFQFNQLGAWMGEGTPCFVLLEDA